MKSAQGHVKEGGIKSSGVNIMAALGDGHYAYFNARWKA